MTAENQEVPLALDALNKSREEADRRYEQRFEAQEVAVAAALAAIQREAQALLQATQARLEGQAHALVFRFESAADLQTERVQQLRRETDEVRSHAAQQFDALASLKANEMLQVERVESLRREAEAVRLAADKAIAKSEAAAELRFHSVNEFREQLREQAGGFLTRAEADAKEVGLAERVLILNERLRALDLGAKDAMTRAAFDKYVEGEAAYAIAAGRQRTAIAAASLLAMFSAVVSVVITLVG